MQCNVFADLLECFSANYPEAMKMNLPILTSDLSFAREVCGEAALYFDPTDELDIFDKIKIVIENKDVRTKLTEKGRSQLNNFCSSKGRAQKYLEICSNIIK